MLTPMKAIRAKCLDCCAGSSNEVRLCSIETCPLHPYRRGHRPKSNLRAETAGEPHVFDRNPTVQGRDAPEDKAGEFAEKSAPTPIFFDKETTQCQHTS